MKILIIRFSSIGDIVLTTPVVRCVKQQVAGAEVHFLTKKHFADILQPNPYIDKVHALEDDFTHTLAELKQEGFHHVLDLHHNLRSARVKAALKAKSHSFYKQNKEKWLMVNFKINHLQNNHIVDRYLTTAESLGIKNDGKGLDYYILPEDEVNITATLPRGYQQGYVGIAIGAKHATKVYPAHKVIKVCNELNRPVVLLGGPEDKSTGDRIERESAAEVFNACGHFRLGQSASLVQQADAIISNDTGIMHIAAAFHKPLVSLWGNTIPEFGMYPYFGEANATPSELLQVQGLSCRPCSKLGYESCPKSHFKCMEEIAPELVVEAVSRVYP